MAATEDPAEEIHRSIEGEEDMIADVTDMGEPAKILNDRVEFMAMDHEETLSTRSRVDAARLDPHIGIHANEISHPFVMVARDVDDPCPATSLAEDLLDHIAVLLGPVETSLHRPEIDEITDHIERLALKCSEKSEKGRGLTSSSTEVNVRDPDTAISGGWVIHFHPLYAGA